MPDPCNPAGSMQQGDGNPTVIFLSSNFNTPVAQAD
jgi:hypothetical protein